jgi:tetratricopeptide (TPR) repeat protein
MKRSENNRLAQQWYERGYALVQEGQYAKALDELRRAADLFRTDDARGRPFTSTLRNGVSGLANTLLLQGQCHQRLDDFTQAARCYETAYINEKFEHRKRFEPFAGTLREGLLACYEQRMLAMSPAAVEACRTAHPAIDIDFRFPFSLEPAFIPLARLYELSPDRHSSFGDLYRRAKTLDAELRRSEKKTDESTMRRISIAVWVMLVILWVVYGLLVAKAILPAW